LEFIPDPILNKGWKCPPKGILSGKFIESAVAGFALAGKSRVHMPANPAGAVVNKGISPGLSLANLRAAAKKRQRVGHGLPKPGCQEWLQAGRVELSRL
jgi:hypothetical protein